VGKPLLGVLVFVAAAVFIAELFGRRRARRVQASLARITAAFTNRRHPSLDLEVASLHSDGEVVWILFRGADALHLPAHLKYDQLDKAPLDASTVGWLRTLNAELKTKALADGWAAHVGFEAADRVAGNPWSYFN
jgi:hypothetical protein